jgi:CelD/BcsL family acetyltransferase involved in cellulose biosynthesis
MAGTAQALRAAPEEALTASQRLPKRLAAVSCRTAHTCIEWARTLEEIAALESSWRKLEANVRTRTVLSTFDYNVTWFQHYGESEGTPLVGVARRGSEVIGIAPLVIRSRRIGRMPVQSVEFVPHEAYAGEFLLEDGHPGLAGAFVDALVNTVAFDVICLNGLEPDTDLFQVIARVAHTHQLSIETTNHPNAVVDLRSGYDRYFAGRTAHFRQSVRRHSRLIGKAGPRDVGGVMLSRGIGEIDDAVTRMIAITEASHKLNGQPLADCHRGFLTELARRFGRRGMLCLPILRIGSRDAAFVFGLVERGTFYDVTLSYDEAWASLRPGTHLIQEMLRQLAAAGVHTVISHGAHEYKRHWATAFVPSTRVFLFAPTPRAFFTRLFRFKLGPVWQRLGASQP